MRFYKHYTRVYINDNVIFLKIKKKHLTHFRNVFVVLIKSNIVINLLKIFIDYFFVTLLEQRIILLKLFIDQQKLKTIVNLNFLKTFDQLKTYLDLIQWLKQYVFRYANKFEFLQNRKTRMLKSTSKVDNVKKLYIFKIKLENSTI